MATNGELAPGARKAARDAPSSGSHLAFLPLPCNKRRATT